MLGGESTRAGVDQQSLEERVETDRLEAWSYSCTFRRSETGNALRTSHIQLIFLRIRDVSSDGLESTLRKTIQILGVSFVLVALLAFATGVVSDWNHQGWSDDAHCPYCHLGHQAPAQLAAAPTVVLLKPVASLPLPPDAYLATGPDFSQTSPRAPPSL